MILFSNVGSDSCFHLPFFTTEIKSILNYFSSSLLPFFFTGTEGSSEALGSGPAARDDLCSSHGQRSGHRFGMCVFLLLFLWSFLKQSTIAQKLSTPCTSSFICSFTAEHLRGGPGAARQSVLEPLECGGAARRWHQQQGDWCCLRQPAAHCAGKKCMCIYSLVFIVSQDLNFQMCDIVLLANAHRQF